MAAAAGGDPAKLIGGRVTRRPWLGGRRLAGLPPKLPGGSAGVPGAESADTDGMLLEQTLAPSSQAAPVAPCVPQVAPARMHAIGASKR